MTVSIYHNSRCSKSRQTLALLKENGVEPTVVEYLKSPPDRETLLALLAMLGLSPRDLMRKGESVYKEMKLADTGLDDEALIDAMLANPILIERPIVVSNGKAVIGRPPENVLDII